jgi:dTDP-glucose 4,6-dehydratase
MPALLITGGAGFIGSNFVRYALAHTADRLVIVDKLSYAGNRLNLESALDDPRVTLIEGDIGDPDLMGRVLLEFMPGAVVNLAAETHVDRSIDAPAAFVRTNIVGTFVLLEAVRRWTVTLDAAPRAAFRFLHVSTDEVYGTLGAVGAFSEETAYAPNSPYAASKASADHLVRAYVRTYGLPAIVTNCSNNYGPYQYPEKLIPLMVLNALDGRRLPIYGDGGQVRDWIHVEDHCAGLLTALWRGRVGEKYHIGGHCERTNLEVVDRLCDVLEECRPAASNPALQRTGASSYRALKTQVADRPGHDRRYAIDAGKIQRELGWAPTRTFDEGLRETVRWYVDHRSWCDDVQAGRYDRERLGLG